MLYFAYGANLNVRGMKRRCPRAKALGVATLAGYRLEFRHFITIVPDTTGDVPGVLYELTSSCWRALDDYEGDDYSKIEVSVKTIDGEHRAVAYVMSGGERAAPALAYFSEIARGYSDWKLDENVLRRARLATLHPVKPEKIRP